MKIKEMNNSLKVTISNPEPKPLLEEIDVYVDKAEDKTAKSGVLFKEYTLSDSTGTITAKMFYGKNGVDTGMAFMVPGNVVKMTLKGEIFAGKPSYLVEKVTGIIPEAKKSDYQISIMPDIDRMQKYMVDMMKWLCEQDENYRIVLENTILLNDETYHKFMVWPAAIHHHHACKHGLLMHTFEVMRTAKRLAEVYVCEGVPIDLPFLMLAALLHDFGKIKEYNFDEETEVIEMSDDSGRNGHIVYMMDLLSKLMTESEAAEMAENNTWFKGYYEQVKNSDKKEFLDDLFRARLKQAIGSHHGKPEYGSPVEMETIEDYILNSADGISASMYTVRYNLVGVPAGATSDRIFELGNARLWNWRTN